MVALSAEWTRLKVVILSVALFAVVIGLAPDVGHAIPVAGTYEFLGQSPLQGTFVSDGIRLTSWSITDPVTPFVWSDTGINQFVVINDEHRFITTLGPTNHYEARLDIFWPCSTCNPSLYGYEVGYDFGTASGTAAFSPVASVPEPDISSLLALGLGLLMLVNYRWRERRQTGVQVG